MSNHYLRGCLTSMSNLWRWEESALFLSKRSKCNVYPSGSQLGVGVGGQFCLPRRQWQFRETFVIGSWGAGGHCWHLT